MFREIGAILIASMCLPSVGAAKDPEPEVLARSDKWVLNYDRDACHLMAEFGKDQAMVVARFTRYRPGDGFDLALYGDRLRSSRVTTDAKIDFGLTGGPIEAQGANGSAGTLKAVFFGSMRLDNWKGKSDGDEAPAITPDQEAAVRSATVAIRGKPAFRLDFGSLRKPLAQMRDCTENLVRSWGYDPAAQAALTRSARPAEPTFKWLKLGDYPSKALMAGHSGIVQIRLDVDPDGKISGCYVLARTSPDEFADVTCGAVSRRGKFVPALDAHGKPVRSYFVMKVRWLMGG